MLFGRTYSGLSMLIEIRLMAPSPIKLFAIEFARRGFCGERSACEDLARVRATSAAYIAEFYGDSNDLLEYHTFQWNKATQIPVYVSQNGTSAGAIEPSEEPVPSRAAPTAARPFPPNPSHTKVSSPSPSRSVRRSHCIPRSKTPRQTSCADEDAHELHQRRLWPAVPHSLLSAKCGGT